MPRPRFTDAAYAHDFDPRSESITAPAAHPSLQAAGCSLQVGRCRTVPRQRGGPPDGAGDGQQGALLMRQCTGETGSPDTASHGGLLRWRCAQQVVTARRAGGGPGIGTNTLCRVRRVHRQGPGWGRRPRPWPSRLLFLRVVALAQRGLRGARGWTRISLVIALTARANSIQSVRCTAPSSAATELAAETGTSRTFHANVRWSRRPGP